MHTALKAFVGIQIGQVILFAWMATRGGRPEANAHPEKRPSVGPGWY